MLPKRLMLCLDDVHDADHSKVALGALVRKLGASLVFYHASRPSKSGLAPDPAIFDALVGDPAFSGIETIAEHVATPFDIVADIERAAAKRQADWLLMPTHARRGIDRLLFGSMSERTIRSCRRPVFTYEIDGLVEKSDVLFDRVVVPVDFSSIAEAVIPIAAEIADRFNARLTLVHVVEDYYTTAYPLTDMPFIMEYRPKLVEASKRHLERIAAQTKRAPGAPPTNVVAEPGVLIEVMKDVMDGSTRPLIALATAGRDSISDWILGSRAERMLRSLHGSVLALPKAALNVSGA